MPLSARWAATRHRLARRLADLLTLLRARRRLNAPIPATLPDGSPIIFRPIVPADHDLMREGFEHLGPESRYRRFFSAVSALTEDDLRFLTDVDQRNHIAWVAVRADIVEGVGVARCIRLAGSPDTAELAITIADRYQRQGVGRALLWLICRAAITRGIHRLTAVVQSDNRPMLTLLRDLGAVTDAREGPTLHLSLPLPRRLTDFDRRPIPALLAHQKRR